MGEGNVLICLGRTIQSLWQPGARPRWVPAGADCSSAPSYRPSQSARPRREQQAAARQGRAGWDGGEDSRVAGQGAQLLRVHPGWAPQGWPGQRSLAVTGSQGICCHLVAALLQLRRQGLQIPAHPCIQSLPNHATQAAVSTLSLLVLLGILPAE